MHILDGLVSDILHGIFDKMNAMNEDDVLSRTHKVANLAIKERLTSAKSACASATKEYEMLKIEIVKSVQGQGNFPVDVLSEMVDSARAKMLRASETLTQVTAEYNQSEERLLELRQDYRNLIEWSKIFDDAEQSVKKMIVGYLIHSIHVGTDYELDIKFNINLTQFEVGLELV